MSRKILKRPALDLYEYQGMVTGAPKMMEFCSVVRRVARTDASVLIRGETGTGKELTAAALHNLSTRSGKPMRAINCATLTPELLASELFGHVRGAFTGAVQDRQGLFAAADGGTVFLDEIAEVPVDVQARLLRVLESRSFTPVGSSEPRTVDVRLISATHTSLREEVERGRFREDLMYRVRVVKLFLPRLVERDGDIEVLTWHFVDHFNQRGYREVTGIEAQVMDAMLAYHWPGNVRELMNVIEGAFAIGEGETITIAELPPELLGIKPGGEERITSASLERERIVDALKRNNGIKGAAAEQLGISRSTLWRKMREYRL